MPDNGKAERFIQSSIREWAYATPFNSSAEREHAMHPWLHDYNTARPHAALAGKSPISRLTRENLLGSDTCAPGHACPLQHPGEGMVLEQVAELQVLSQHLERLVPPQPLEGRGVHAAVHAGGERAAFEAVAAEVA